MKYLVSAWRIGIETMMLFVGLMSGMGLFVSLVMPHMLPVGHVEPLYEDFNSSESPILLTTSNDPQNANYGVEFFQGGEDNTNWRLQG